MKYIDSEKLIAEIERLYEIARNASYNGEVEGEMTAYDKILSFIDSLQQEQPKFRIGDTIHKKGENTVFPMVIERISDGDYVCDNAHSFINIKYQDDYELVQQEQPEVDLEKKIDDYLYSIERWEVEDEPYRNLDKCARHFYELGLNARK